MANEISTFLGISPIENKPKSRAPVVHSEHVRDNVKDDYEQVRQSMKDMIRDGTDAITILSNLAKESESPRAYEVFAITLKTITEMNKALMDLHKDAKELMTQQDNIHDNADESTIAFVGSTEELQRHLKELNANSQI